MPDLSYGKFCQDSDAADVRRGDVVPVEELPGLVAGREKLRAALRLLDQPMPGALDDARRAVGDALDLLPQGRRAPHCREYRWRSGQSATTDGVCSVRTCGRCAPLRAARDERENSA